MNFSFNNFKEKETLIEKPKSSKGGTAPHITPSESAELTEVPETVLRPVGVNSHTGSQYKFHILNFSTADNIIAINYVVEHDGLILSFSVSFTEKDKKHKINHYSLDRNFTVSKIYKVVIESIFRTFDNETLEKIFTAFPINKDLLGHISKPLKGIEKFIK